MLLNHIHWNPDPELFNLFGLSIRYYGLLFAAGVLLAISILRSMFKRDNIPTSKVDSLMTYGVLGIVFGARVGHCLFYEPTYFLANPLEIILPISFGVDGQIKFTGFQGLASHGGVLGLAIGLMFYSRKHKIPFLQIVDYIAIVTGFTGMFIRTANFANSEIIGSPTDKSWGIIFELVDNTPRHPAQLYEAFCCLIIFIIMMTLYRKNWAKVGHGFYIGLALVLIFVSRFAIEFLKENQVGFEEGMLLNMGQILSIPYIILGIFFILRSKQKAKINKAV